MEQEMKVGFIGNPNCGKTTLFNAFTGAHLKVANWPGVTVEKVEGAMRYHDHTYQLVDLPGTYSLTSYTMEEQVARRYILSDDVDVVVDVVDASSLERNLYLTLQLLELGKPVVVALNMMDIVQKRGMEIDLHRLPEMLGVPVIPVSAQKRTGLDILIHTIAHHRDGGPREPLQHHHRAGRFSHLHEQYAMVYSDELEEKIAAVSDALKARYPQIENFRWHAIKLLERDREITESYPLDMPQVLDRSYESDIINQKYDFIEEIIAEVLMGKQKQAALTDKIDRVLLHNIWAIPAFLGIMALVFFLTFTIGDWMKGYFEMAVGWLSDGAAAGLGALRVSPTVISLVVDGVIAGVGGILSFLPNIFILFLALAFLEDSGYMSRVTYVMNGLMGKLGLSGRAFIPMILGFGCTVPALMASRVLESQKDRYRTMLITPFMSCSARLPIYILFSGLFFPDCAMLVAYSMYLIGILVAILVAFVLSKWDRAPKSDMLLIELPEYKLPSARTVRIYVWEKVKDYLTKAGTTIFVASIALWFLCNFGPSGYTADATVSFAAYLGRLLVPVLAPVGLGFWQVVVALIAGISAKEVVVSSFIVLFGIQGTATAAESAALTAALGQIGFGPLNAFCMMLFCLLYIPCAATLATVKKEMGSFKRMWQVAAFQLGTAWAVTFVVYQVAALVMGR
ncbi:ferrous iron transport protein B [Neobittarella massiliensis]|uniref:Ferrous iron transport protein B n=1 Tax=Neobittarella massiliensis (ex Bilen et al. 2018) TaxID=2041842 RepID=A0A8J6IQE4_9FIRM|nr:ferrous iron transport protein B [Neobittarella massiliensis]MBC3516173.1 ferrous iron transport protein B [Neobittarella massiliensis]